MDVDELKALLGLKPLPEEGGFYAETYRTVEAVDGGGLPARYGSTRSLGTAIYYLLTPDTFSAMHRLRSDEVYHFYLGDPVEMLQLWPDGSGKVAIIGNDLRGGMRPQLVVPQGVWQGSRLRPGGEFALMGTTMSPGWDAADFELGGRDALIQKFPAFADRILELTR